MHKDTCERHTRGPLSLGRLTKAADGTVRYTMKRVIRGKQDLVLTGLQLVEQLVRCTARAASCDAAAYPAAPGSKLRSMVVPERLAAVINQENMSRFVPTR